ncbi:MAG: hypothetical protein ABH824_05790 [Nanoarchaeota archaeon]|nr:hypothetical protein [Nanoarchaeota archaeon]MBU1632404.1 hypothetical protein [Nanoarchaeota archaeon]MBU1876568.1 hypothetical protein [Nanoarchaeota archaeon]
MEIKDIQANQGNIDIVAEVIEKEDSRSFEKFGKVGKVCNSKIKDPSGNIKLTLWNEDIDKINVGDKIHLQNGWCSEFKGEKQISTGKFGKIEVLEKTERKSDDKTVYTNDPNILTGKFPDMETDVEEESTEDYSEDDADIIREEELVE